MATDQLIRLFAEQNRVRAFAAVALGAETSEQVAEVAGLTPRGTAVALLRLREQGVVKTMDDGELRVDYDLFKQLAREGDEPAEDGPVTGDEHTDMILRTFVRGGRLIRLPAQWTRKQVVLQHIAEQTFAPGMEYPERIVNEKLRAWCDEGEVDHVTLRRYLVDLHHLRRSEGIYRLSAAA
ncbi:DUF2087 domain-containing protein [Streptomyces sp. NPDC051554]|uniref:DUF2087 domain-containing protein n=1 Tax=unclassified Streptomyces TaxID=2593676 RepID=UPI0037AE9DFC|nr:DUF2087 domain-containing protein [Streptomyces sp. NBC_00988]